MSSVVCYLESRVGEILGKQVVLLLAILLVISSTMAACANLLTYKIKEGQIQNVDMKGIIIICHMDGIGPKHTDLANGVKEGAAYISENATDEQGKILEPFIMSIWRAGCGENASVSSMSRLI